MIRAGSPMLVDCKNLVFGCLLVSLRRIHRGEQALSTFELRRKHRGEQASSTFEPAGIWSWGVPSCQPSQCKACSTVCLEARLAKRARAPQRCLVPRGLEPRTLRLLAVRSDQLSYETHGKGRQLESDVSVLHCPGLSHDGICSQWKKL